MNTHSTFPETSDEQQSRSRESDIVHSDTEAVIPHSEKRLGDFAMEAPRLTITRASAPVANTPHARYGTLFIVSTPIGNQDDITLRALKILKQSDIVVGEEGKTVARLLHDHRITKKLEELNEHNEHEQTNRLFQLLKNGKTLSLVSDAGTPLLADPGAHLVRRAIDAGITVRAIPGATSIMAALTTSGLPMESFVFAGFVSREPSERLQELKRLAQEARTVVVLETPYRLIPLLEAARQIMPQRRAYIGCNLTMDSETHHYGTVSELYTKFVVSRFKGEFVFCFEGLQGSQMLVSSPTHNERQAFAKGRGKRGSSQREGKFDRPPDSQREGAKRFDDKRQDNKRDGTFKHGSGSKGKRGFKNKGGDSKRGDDVRHKPDQKGTTDESSTSTSQGNAGTSSAPSV